MVMSWIWTGILAVSIMSAFLTGRSNELARAILEGAQGGLSLALSIGGAICLWTGVGRLMEHAGITDFLSALMRPVLNKLFPSTKTSPAVARSLSGNICANILGLGNAATPLGIQAVTGMKDPNNPSFATNEMCRLIVLNTASIQLIPANVAALRASLGAASPFDILPAVWTTSLCSAGLGLCAAILLGKVWHYE